MAKHVVEISDLYKGYTKREMALRGLSMTVPEGSVYGFIGQNGAGKSTTIKAVLGLIRPNGGSVAVFGEDAWGISPATKQRIAYVPEVSFHFAWMTIGEMMAYVARFYAQWNQALANQLLDALDLAPEKKISALSLGQGRWVSLSIALACNPDLLILDEPAGNLDVVARRILLQHILEFARREGKTVLLSSHVLTDLEQVVDRIGIVRKGEMLVEDDLDNLKERLTRLRVVYDNDAPQTFDVPNLIHCERFGNEASLTVFDFDRHEVYPSIRHARIETQPLSLEDIFVAYAQAVARP